MAEPWFSDPTAFGAWYGAIVGGGGGTLLGLLGAAAGCLAPQGRGRPWVLGGMLALLVLGLIQLIAGIVALAGGQPYGIWYPLLLTGALFTIILGALFPAVRRRYEAADQRRIEARAIRNG